MPKNEGKCHGCQGCGCSKKRNSEEKCTTCGDTGIVKGSKQIPCPDCDAEEKKDD